MKDDPEDTCAELKRMAQPHEGRRDARCHKKQDGDPVRRDTGIAGRDAVTPKGEDPVAPWREVQDEGVNRGDGDPPEDRDLEHAADEFAQHKFDEGRRVHGNACRAGDPDRKAQRQTRHGEQRAKGHDQRRNRGFQDQQPVGQPDNHAKAQCCSHPDPDRKIVIAAEDGKDHGPRRDHRPDRNVQLARNHQKPDRKRYNAERRRDVEPTRHTGGGNEIRAGKGREEAEDGHHAEERPGFGAAHQVAE